MRVIASRRGLAAGLLLLMLLVQQLGLLHRYQHGGSWQPGFAQAGTGHSQAAEDAGSGKLWPPDSSAGLPGHERIACMLLDQACMADALAVSPPVFVSSEPVAGQLLQRLLPFFAAYQVIFWARGPPVLG